MQTADKIKPCYPLFPRRRLQEEPGDKRVQFEEMHNPDKVWETFLDHHQGISGSQLPARSPDG